MKLTVNLVDGRTLTYEGTYDELVKVGEDCVERFGNIIANPAEAAEIQPRHVTTVKVVNGNRRWT